MTYTEHPFITAMRLADGKHRKMWADIIPEEAIPEDIKKEMAEYEDNLMTNCSCGARPKFMKRQYTEDGKEYETAWVECPACGYKSEEELIDGPECDETVSERQVIAWWNEDIKRQQIKK